MKMKKYLFLEKIAFCCLILAVIVSTACSSSKAGTASYEFITVSRGTLERTVSASGTINPVSTVKVLPQMSGKVEKVHVDYNDPVRKGDVLAELNTDMLKLKREQQSAAVQKAKANYELQLRNYQSQLSLAERNFISEFELLSSKTTLDNLAADLAVAEANLRVIETEINQYAFIISPIDGIVLDRNINIGDTVVDSSSNNSYNIFTLAENLREMQIEATVGELDITSIEIGQAVRFTLESLSGRTFRGEVETLRMVPVVSNNVVSYTVVIKVENLDGSLLPGMTCAVDFIVGHSENVLMVPNTALRYQPTDMSEEKIADMVFYAGIANLGEEQQKVMIEARAQNTGQNSSQNTNTGLQNIMTSGGGQNMRPQGNPGGGMSSAMGQSSPRRGMEQGRNSNPASTMRNLWYINDDGKLDVIRVSIGISSGSFTEIRSMEDIEGKQFILREKIS